MTGVDIAYFLEAKHLLAGLSTLFVLRKKSILLSLRLMFHHLKNGKQV